MNNKYRGCLPIEDLTYENLRKKFWDIVRENNLEGQEVSVLSARTLKPEQAIGNPERKDYPLVKGREVMVQAEFMGAQGQAFTDMPGDFKGTMAHILDFSLSDNFQRAVFIAALNALLRHLNCIECTSTAGTKNPKTAPATWWTMSKSISVPPKSVLWASSRPWWTTWPGTSTSGSRTWTKKTRAKKNTDSLWSRVEHTREVIEWADVVFATGSTIVNNTYRTLFRDRPLVFYGVTVTGIAYLSGCDQYCHLGH